MYHQIVNGVCIGCQRTLLDCHPDLQEWFNGFVVKNFDNVHISCGWRGKEEQDRAYDGERSNVKWPYSKHNRMTALDKTKPFNPKDEKDPNAKKESLALDLFQIIEGHASFNRSFYESLNRLNLSFGKPIRYGGGWAGSHIKGRDYNHFELSTIV